MIAGIVLAAGESKRFHGAKQLAELNGRPLLEHALEPMLDAGLERIVVVLGARAQAILAGVDFLGAEVVVCESWRLGVGASLACAISKLENEEAVVITLGDQPGLSAATIRYLIANRGRAPALRATYGGQPSHPVLLERELFPRLQGLTGDGARQLFETVEVHQVACDDLGSGADIDTRADLAMFAQALRGQGDGI